MIIKRNLQKNGWFDIRKKHLISDGRLELDSEKECIFGTGNVYRLRDSTDSIGSIGFIIILLFYTLIFIIFTV